MLNIVISYNFKDYYMLKPSEMGVTGIKRTISLHKKMVQSKLKQLSKIKGRPKKVADVCLKIMEVSSGGVVDIKGLEPFDLSEIKNFFAEVMGPIWSAEMGLISGLKMSDNTFFSKSDSEALYDFKVFRRNEEILVSNKQKSGGTNTLKPADVVRLINLNPSLSKKWRNTIQYKVFDILNTKNAIAGPISAVAKCYPRMVKMNQGDYNTIISQMNVNDILIKDPPKNLMNLIKADPTTFQRYKATNVVSGTMVNFLFERLLVRESERDATYNDLFIDATEDNILFLKFDLSNKGVVSFLISNPRESKKKAKLRSKQGVERRSESTGRLRLDKLGFQP